MYKTLRFLRFWFKLNTHRIVKTCPFCFLRDSYGDSLDVMFPQFPFKCTAIFKPNRTLYEH